MNKLNNSRELQKDLSSEIIDEFFSGLEFCLDLFRSSYNELTMYLTDDFNVFEYIQPDENKLSDIIADLLDTRGEHGQGDVFLNAFLQLINIPVCERINGGVVFREESTINRRRIDITLHGNNMGIGIENKPWAEDIHRQIEDYIKELNIKYTGNFVFVYLSGKGDSPSQRSISIEKRKKLESENKFKIISYYPDLKCWIDVCIKECKADKMKWFLLDFSNYIENNFTTDNLEVS